LGKKNENQIYEKNCKSKLGDPNILQKGKDICIIGTGNILYNALKACKKLNKKVKPHIVNIHTIKPINRIKIIKILKKFKKIIILEEHVETGGLTSLLMKLSGENKIKNQFISHNTGNKFLIGLNNNKKYNR